MTDTNYVRTDNVHSLEKTDSSEVSFLRFINVVSTSLTDTSGPFYDTNSFPIGPTNSHLLDELDPSEAVFLNQVPISNIIGDTWTGKASLILSKAYEDLHGIKMNFVNDGRFSNFSYLEPAN